MMSEYAIVAPTSPAPRMAIWEVSLGSRDMVMDWVGGKLVFVGGTSVADSLIVEVSTFFLYQPSERRHHDDAKAGAIRRSQWRR